MPSSRWFPALMVLCASVALAAVVHAVLIPSASGVTRPRCFGAASRDPEQPCRNPQLRHRVIPSPAYAAAQENSPCTRIEEYDLVHPCAFGVAPEAAPTETIVLLGDSHAAHWRAALDVVARERNWRGLSISRTSCSFSRATKLLSGRARAQCKRWNRKVIEWFERHPEVKTVFAAQIAGDVGVVTNGRTPFWSRVAGYRSAWNALPASVERIVVIRDTPRMRASTRGCVERAMTARRPAGLACAISRSRALIRDPAAVAASRTRSKRVHLLDLTRFMCSRRSCFPVVGGALVFKDIHHLTEIYATTLGHYMLRELDRTAKR